MEKSFPFAFFSYLPPYSNDTIPYHAAHNIVYHIIRFAQSPLEYQL